MSMANPTENSHKRLRADDQLKKKAIHDTVLPKNTAKPHFRWLSVPVSLIAHTFSYLGLRDHIFLGCVSQLLRSVSRLHGACPPLLSYRLVSKKDPLPASLLRFRSRTLRILGPVNDHHMKQLASMATTLRKLEIDFSRCSPDQVTVLSSVSNLNALTVASCMTPAHNDHVRTLYRCLPAMKSLRFQKGRCDESRVVLPQHLDAVARHVCPCRRRRAALLRGSPPSHVLDRPSPGIEQVQCYSCKQTRITYCLRRFPNASFGDISCAIKIIHLAWTGAVRSADP